MPMTVVPVTPSFAAEIGDVDLSKPIEAADVAAIKDADNRLEQRPIAARRPVLQHRPVPARQQFVCDLAKLVPWKADGIGIPGSK